MMGAYIVSITTHLVRYTTILLLQSMTQLVGLQGAPVMFMEEYDSVYDGKI
jgi:hypothetical protein